MLKHYFAYHTLSKVAFVYFFTMFRDSLKIIIYVSNILLRRGEGLTHAGQLRELNNSFCSYKHRYSVF